MALISFHYYYYTSIYLFRPPRLAARMERQVYIVCFAYYNRSDISVNTNVIYYISYTYKAPRHPESLEVLSSRYTYKPHCHGSYYKWTVSALPLTRWFLQNQALHLFHHCFFGNLFNSGLTIVYRGNTCFSHLAHAVFDSQLSNLTC